MSDTEVYGLDKPVMSLVLPLYGGTMRGPVLLFRETPVESAEAASKAYVDRKAGEGAGGASPWVDLELVTDIIEQQIPLQARTIAGGYLCEVRGKFSFLSYVEPYLQITDKLPVEMHPDDWVYQAVFVTTPGRDFSETVPILKVFIVAPDGRIWIRDAAGGQTGIQPGMILTIASCYATSL